MPYIKQELREQLEYPLDVLGGHLGSMLIDKKEDRAGILNYVITSLIDSVYGPLKDAKYKDYNEVIGMLECCKLEFYRRGVAPYEDLKERENGSVLDSNFSVEKGTTVGQIVKYGKDLSRKVPTEKGGTITPFFNTGNNIIKEPIQVTKCNLIFSIKVNLDTIVYIRANSFRDAAVIFDGIEQYKDKPDACNMMLESHWEDLDKNLKNEFLNKEFKSTNIEDGLYIIMKNVTDE